MKRSRDTVVRPILMLVGVTVICVTAIVMAWIMSRDVPGSLHELDPQVEPLTVPASTSSLTYSTDAALSATFEEGPHLVAPQGAGVVTRIETGKGQEIGVGTTPFYVDDVPVTAYVGSTVFYRQLGKGAVGDDVRGLQELLSSLMPEMYIGVDGEFGDNTELAVKEWQKTIGIVKPDGVFQPTWFVRLPTQPFVVDALAIQVGAPLPAPGDDIAIPRLAVSEIVLTPSAESETPDGQYELAVSGKKTDVVLEDGQWTFNDPESVRDLLPGPTEESGMTVSAEANIHMKNAEEGTVVPAAAIVAAGNEECVYVPAGDTYDPVPVTMLDGTPDGGVLIDSSIAVGTQVLINPQEMLDEPQCQSS